MALAYTTLELYRGDTATWKLTITEPGATPEDPPVPMVLPTTGWTGQVRESADSETVIASFEVNVTEAASGILYLHLDDDASEACASGVWDLQNWTEENGTKTYLRGPFVVDPDVTRV
jgi:hypothetical protein